MDIWCMFHRRTTVWFMAFALFHLLRTRLLGPILSNPGSSEGRHQLHPGRRERGVAVADEPASSAVALKIRIGLSRVV